MGFSPAFASFSIRSADIDHLTATCSPRFEASFESARAAQRTADSDVEGHSSAYEGGGYQCFISTRRQEKSTAARRCGGLLPGRRRILWKTRCPFPKAIRSGSLSTFGTKARSTKRLRFW